MKKQFILILLGCAVVQGFGQAPNWQWARNGAGSDNDQGNSIISDANGKSYITGSFDSPTITFGSFTLTNTATNQTGDVYVVKYDASGNVLWARQAGSNSIDGGYGITVDPFGNIYVTGTFSGPSMQVGTYTLINSGSGTNDIFVIKYDSTGSVLWARSINGSGGEAANGIASDLGGNIFITGSFQSSALTLGSLTLTNANSATSDFFVTKYNTYGTPLWAKSAGGSGNESGYGVSLTDTYFGNLCVTGYFTSSTVSFDSYTLTNTNANQDIFTVKYDSTGAVMWARGTGGTGDESGFSIASDANSNVYVTGYFTSPAISFASNTLTNANINTQDLFLLKFDASGNPVWGRYAGGNATENGAGICADAGGYVYITGYFSSPSITFGSNTITNTNNNNTADIFIAKYDPSGNAVWAKNAGGTDGDIGSGVAVDANGDVYVTGTFQSSSVTFGSGSLNNTNFGSGDAFDARLGICSAIQPNICMVTVDSLSQYNVIIWDKTPYTNVDSFIVYREITTNNYQRIGAVPYASLSRFVDTVRTLYFPNTGDPNSGTYRYKLQTHDTCGNYSALGPYHNTIFMTHTGGTFTWPQLYTIENSANPVNAYVLLRDDYSTGNWQPINSVAGTQQSITDPAYSAWQLTANWRIQTLWNITCTPTLRLQNGIQATYGSSYSNTTNSLAGINDISLADLIRIAPNPSGGKFTVQVTGGQLKIYKLEVYNMFGEKIYGKPVTAVFSDVDISGKPSGLYFICLETDKGTVSKKLLIQK